MSRVTASAPDLIFRLLGYGGLGAVAVTRLLADGSAGLWLLLGFVALWPPCWWWLVQRFPRLRSPQAAVAQLAHASECLLILALVALAGLELWFAVAIALLCLCAVTAFGGLHLLAPCAMATGVALLLQSRGLAQTTVVNPATIASGMLVASFLLGLAFTSFKKVRRLDGHHRLALVESATLQHRNERLARYLPGDLTPLVSARPAIVNRPRDQFVTVAFVDVVGFVELVASRPMAELVEVVNDFIATVTALTERRGGVVGKFLGDGVLVYFPERPADCPDERWQAAVSCVNLCLDLGPGLATLADTWRRRGVALDLHTRAGIASGYCAIGDWGGTRRLDYTLIGTPVNLASRLQAQAPDGGVLLSAVTADLIREDPRLAAGLSAGCTKPIKGFGPVMVHELSASAKVRANPNPRPDDSTDGHHGKDIPAGLQR